MQGGVHVSQESSDNSDTGVTLAHLTTVKINHGGQAQLWLG